jgi:probable H4MPT-linked C1 transfer pathway protein
MARKQKAGWIGLDVGGANIKAVDLVSIACAINFPLWREPERLATELSGILEKFDGIENIAVTMTGELADCFQTKREGVEFICKACEDAAGTRKVVFYSVKGRFYSRPQANEKWQEVASSNWHALATIEAKKATDNSGGLVVDIGSTTTDIVPYVNKKPCPKGWNDTDRLAEGELIYTGVERSSIAGITSKLPLRGKLVPVMNELFATSLDAYLLLGNIDESESNAHTADGRAATKANAHTRLARMVGGDASTVSRCEAEEMAEFIAVEQAKMIASALRRMLPKFPGELQLSGHGPFLLKRAVDLLSINAEFDTLDLRADIGSRCAPAIAVAELAQEYFSS